MSDGDPNQHGTKENEFNFAGGTGYLELTLPSGPGIVAVYETDQLGRATKVTRGPANLTKEENYQFDPAGNVTWFKDADGNETWYEYDGLNRLRKEKIVIPSVQTAPLERVWVYDAAGNLQQYKDRDGQTTNYLYDALGRRTDEIVTSGPAYHAEYEYYQDGNLKSAKDANSEYQYSLYDARGRAGVLLQTLKAGTYSTVTTEFVYVYDDHVVDPTVPLARREYVVTATVAGLGLQYQNFYRFDAAGREVLAVQNSPDASDKGVEHTYHRTGAQALIPENDSTPYATRYDEVRYYQFSQGATPQMNLALEIDTFYVSTLTSN